MNRRSLSGPASLPTVPAGTDAIAAGPAGQGTPASARPRSPGRRALAVTGAALAAALPVAAAGARPPADAFTTDDPQPGTARVRSCWILRHDDR
jgi:hypothetical protein